MLETISFPVHRESVVEYGSAEALSAACRAQGCDGIEAVWGGDDALSQLPVGLVVGYHLMFYPDWVDFWNGSEGALLQKFGSRAAWTSFYGAENRAQFVARYREDLRRAELLQVRYVVFHVSDVSLEEAYTYRWLHGNRAVLDASLELLNLLLEDRSYCFEILVENQWWPGFTFLDPSETDYLLRGIRTEKKGIMLDTGHLMNTNPALRSEADGIQYLHTMLDRCGSLCGMIRGVHLHQSLSGAYVKDHTGMIPVWKSDGYLARFEQSYSHILQIDRHQPWTDPRIVSVLRRIQPAYLTHELSCKNRAERASSVRLQRGTLQKGNFYEE